MAASPTFFPDRNLRRISAVLSLGLALAGCGGNTTRPIVIPPSTNTFSTTVAPLAGEDLAAPCNYDLLIQNPAQTQAGVLVIFERSDSSTLFADAGIRSMAASMGYAMIFAHECDAKSYADLQANASLGPGRALFTALNQLATASGHAELATSNVVLNGFSAAGVLTATMEDYAPARITAAIIYAPGANYLELLTVPIAAAALKIPTLILANAQDPLAGTTRGYQYFLKGRNAGAPWAFAVQNVTGHCCNLTTRNMMLAWVPPVASGPTSAATVGEFVCAPDGILDGVGQTNCRFTKATVGASTAVAGEQASWLPSTAAATAWLAWVTNPATN